MNSVPIAPPREDLARPAVRGVAWGAVEAIAGAIGGLIVTPLLVRESGLAGLGLWAAAWSGAHTSAVADLGVAASYTHFAARHLARGEVPALNRVLSAGSGFYLALWSLLLPLAWLAWPHLSARLAPAPALAAEAPWVVACALVTVALRAGTGVFRGVLAGAQRVDLLGRIGAATAAGEAALVAAALLSGAGLKGAAAAGLAAASAASFLEWRAARRVLPGLRVRPFAAGRADWRALLGFGARLQATRAAEILAGHVPRLALAFGAGLHATGAYDLGLRLAGLLRIGAGLPLPVIQPLAGRLEARGESARLMRLVERATRYVGLLAAAGLAVILIDAPALLLLWTGDPAPPEAAMVARLLAVALTVGLVISPLRLALRGAGRPGIEAAAATAATTVHLTLALLLAPRLGAAGVAAAMLPAVLLAAAVLENGARRSDLRPAALVLPRALAGPAAAAAAAVSAGILVHWTTGEILRSRQEALAHLLPEMTLAIGVLAVGAVAAGVFRREEWAALVGRSA